MRKFMRVWILAGDLWWKGWLTYGPFNRQYLIYEWACQEPDCGFKTGSYSAWTVGQIVIEHDKEHESEK